MPEPFTIATATIGTSIGILGVLVSTLSGLNGRRRSIIDFSPRVHGLIKSLKRCQSDLTEWDAVWNWKAYSDYVYQQLWDDKFESINRQRADVGVHADNLSKYVKDFLGIGQDEPGETWRDSISRRGRVRLLLTKFRFALFSEQTLRDMIALLDGDIKNLKDLCNKRFKILERATPAPKMSERAAGQFMSLGEFGQKVWALRRQEALATTCSGWALELWPSGHSRSARLSDWQTMTEVQISIAFQHNDPTGENHDRSVSLKYTLEKQLAPGNWADGLANTVQDEQNAERNPIIDRQHAHYERTATFRDLFKRDLFFDSLPLSKTWESDLSHLLLSLANWSALLWYTNWTRNLCSSGIRYVRRQNERSFLHTLSLGQDHDPDQQQDEEHDDLERCSHGGSELKLKNLGLVIAELICTTPFRFLRTDTSRYERWDHTKWRGTTKDHILDDVETRSRSIGVREAVYFCLTSEEGRSISDGLGAFLHYYEAEVIKPLKDWSAVIHDPRNHELLAGVLERPNGSAWPMVAFEGGHDTDDNTPPSPAIPGAWPESDTGE